MGWVTIMRRGVPLPLLLVSSPLSSPCLHLPAAAAPPSSAAGPLAAGPSPPAPTAAGAAAEALSAGTVCSTSTSCCCSVPASVLPPTSAASQGLGAAEMEAETPWRVCSCMVGHSGARQGGRLSSSCRKKPTECGGRTGLVHLQRHLLASAPSSLHPALAARQPTLSAAARSRRLHST
jgi:hypothetical protein